MTDGDLRGLRRTWEATGSRQDLGNLLHQAARAGLIPTRHFEVLLALQGEGSPASALTLLEERDRLAATALAAAAARFVLSRVPDVPMYAPATEEALRCAEAELERPGATTQERVQIVSTQLSQVSHDPPAWSEASRSCFGVSVAAFEAAFFHGPLESAEIAIERAVDAIARDQEIELKDALWEGLSRQLVKSVEQT